MRIAIFTYCCLAVCFTKTACARDLGTRAEIFKIEEQNLSRFLQNQINQAFDSKKNDLEKMKKNIEKQALNPSPISHLRNATKNRKFYLDPTFSVPEDIEDVSGNVIVKAGTKINPLKETHLKSGLLFFNGDDPNHLRWARSQMGSYKWILVQGKPMQLEQEELRPIYFDQKGFYTEKFQIHHIPAKVDQKGDRLFIQEEALSNLEALP